MLHSRGVQPYSAIQDLGPSRWPDSDHQSHLAIWPSVSTMHHAMTRTTSQQPSVDARPNSLASVGVCARVPFSGDCRRFALEGFWFRGTLRTAGVPGGCWVRRDTLTFGWTHPSSSFKQLVSDRRRSDEQRKRARNTTEQTLTDAPSSINRARCPLFPRAFPNRWSLLERLET